MTSLSIKTRAPMMVLFLLCSSCTAITHVDEFEVERETASGDVDAFVEELARYLVDRRA